MRKRCGYQLLCVLLLASALSGCGDKISAPDPVRTPAPAFPTVPQSHIRLSMDVPLPALASRLNRMTASKLIETERQKVKCGFGKCRLSLLATRNGQILLAGTAGRLAVSLPFDAVARLRLPGVFSAVKTRVHVTGTAHIVSQPALDSSGQMQIRSHGKIQLSGGTLRLGPVRTSLADIWNANADTLSNPVFHAMDKQISRAVQSRRELEHLWRTAYRPVKVAHKPNIWLETLPQSLAVGTVRVSDQQLSLPVQLDFTARLQVQQGAPETHPAGLPPLRHILPGTNGYALYVPVVLPFNTAAKLVEASLHQHPLHVAGYRITVSRVRFLPSGQDVVLRADFCAGQPWDLLNVFSGCGTLYFRGVPYYDAKTEQIRIRQLHYDLSTQNLLLQTLQSLAGNSFSRDLSEKIHLRLSGKIRRLRQGLQDTLAAGTKGPVHVSGTLSDFTPYALSWTQNGFVALVRARGKAAFAFRP